MRLKCNYVQYHFHPLLENYKPYTGPTISLLEWVCFPCRARSETNTGINFLDEKSEIFLQISPKFLVENCSVRLFTINII